MIKNVKNIRFSLKRKLINLRINRESFFDNGLKIKLKINLAKLNVFLNKDLIKLRINLKNNLRNGGRTYFITKEVIQYKNKNSSLPSFSVCFSSFLISWFFDLSALSLSLISLSCSVYFFLMMFVELNFYYQKYN
jgi:hypothetical protein